MLEGTLLGYSDGTEDGAFEGESLGMNVGVNDGKSDGMFEGTILGIPDGYLVGISLGILDGMSLGMTVGLRLGTFLIIPDMPIRSFVRLHTPQVTGQFSRTNSTSLAVNRIFSRSTHATILTIARRLLQDKFPRAKRKRWRSRHSPVGNRVGGKTGDEDGAMLGLLLSPVEGVAEGTVGLHTTQVSGHLFVSSVISEGAKPIRFSSAQAKIERTFFRDLQVIPRADLKFGSSAQERGLVLIEASSSFRKRKALLTRGSLRFDSNLEDGNSYLATFSDAFNSPNVIKDVRRNIFCR